MTVGSQPPVLKVVPKSTHRKQRADAPAREKLAPAQQRSRVRHEDILKAVERLLAVVNIEDLSHSDIATEAGISKASVHYHFPTIAAVQRELGRRYDQQLYEVHRAFGQRLSPDEAHSWQDCMRAGSGIARDWLNVNRPACEALYGPMLHRENRLAGFSYNSRVAEGMVEVLRARAGLPDDPRYLELFTASTEIQDLFWSTAYLRHGRIDDGALEESLRACFGYLRNYLPDVLLPLQTLRA